MNADVHSFAVPLQLFSVSEEYARAYTRSLRHETCTLALEERGRWFDGGRDGEDDPLAHLESW